MLRFCLTLLAWLSAALPAFAQGANIGASMGAGMEAGEGVSARSEHFVLVSDASVDARTLLSDLEAFRIAVAADLGLPEVRQPPLRISIVDDPDLFTAVSPGGLTAAIYRQSAVGPDVVLGYDSRPGRMLSRALEPEWLRLVLRHETVHHLLETRYPRKLPIWLGEGLAEYYASYRRGPDGRPVFGHALPEQEVPSPTQDWLPLRNVIESLSHYPDFRLSGQTPTKAQRLYYGQSWALANFVMDQPEGLARIHRFVDGWSDGRTGEDSFQQAFGLGYEGLEARLRQAVSQERPLYPDPVTPKTGIAVTSGTADGTDIARNHLRLLLTHGRLGEDVDQRIDALSARLGEAADTLDLDLARSLRLWRWKDWDGATAAAETALRRDPDNASALKMRAKAAYGQVSERQSEGALWDVAEIAALQALAVDPNDAELHLFHVAVSLPTDVRLTPNARASLDWLQTQRTHLRRPHTAMMMVPALIYENRFDQADAVLDSAARWASNPDDRWVIERLRGNVASERAKRR
ncbi:MAG: hypothetical protein WBG08_06600 [Litorimonas sp.]